jgi:hypothetical protein
MIDNTSPNIESPVAKKREFLKDREYSIDAKRQRDVCLVQTQHLNSELKQLALRSAAKAIHRFDSSYLQHVLSCSDSSVGRALTSFCCEHNNLTDEIISIVISSQTREIVVGGQVSSAGLSYALNKKAPQFDDYSDLSSWEDIDPSTELECDFGNCLEVLYFIESRVTLTPIVELFNRLGELKHLVLHNVKATLNSAFYPSGLMSEILTRLKNLCVLEVSYCEWMAFDILESWYRHVMHHDIGHERSDESAIRVMIIHGLEMSPKQRTSLHLIQASLQSQKKITLEVPSFYILEGA